jgi:phage repressor protein C with HTH and peptisase S24 domain
MGIVNNIYQFIGEIKVSPYEFSKKVGLSQGYLSNLKSKNGQIGNVIIEKIINTYPSLNPTWLLTGKGDMLLGDYNNPKPSLSTPTVSKNKPETKARGIPLIPIDAMAGFSSGDFTVNNYDVDYFWVMPEFKRAEFVIRVQGESMAPIFNTGDYVICMYAKERDVIEWGKPYVVDAQSGAYLKYLESGLDDQHITLASENPRHKPYQITKPSIRALALVIGCVKCL